MYNFHSAPELQVTNFSTCVGINRRSNVNRRCGTLSSDHRAKCVCPATSNRVEATRNRVGVTIAVLVDRSEGKVSFPSPLVSLLEMNFPTYEPENLPPALRNIPAVKPGS